MKYIIDDINNDALSNIQNVKLYTMDELIRYTCVDAPQHRCEGYFLNQAVQKLKDDGKSVSAVVSYSKEYHKTKSNENTGQKYWYLDDLQRDVNGLLKNGKFKYVYLDLTGCADFREFSGKMEYFNIAEPWYIFQGINAEANLIYRKLKWLDYKSELFDPVKDIVMKRLKQKALDIFVEEFKCETLKTLNTLDQNELTRIIERRLENDKLHL
jgi:hypothetical protein